MQHRAHGSHSRKAPPAGRLIGYARVSTDDQGTDPQLDELQAAGCAEILEEHASGADRGRPVLARLLRTIMAGDTLVVVRLDRLARSVSHLLAVIEQLVAGYSWAGMVLATFRRKIRCPGGRAVRFERERSARRERLGRLPRRAAVLMVSEADQACCLPIAWPILIKLSAITPRPTQRFIPSSP
jgi:hypothetical protein